MATVSFTVALAIAVSYHWFIEFINLSLHINMFLLASSGNNVSQENTTRDRVWQKSKRTTGSRICQKHHLEILPSTVPHQFSTIGRNAFASEPGCLNSTFAEINHYDVISFTCCHSAVA